MTFPKEGQTSDSAMDGVMDEIEDLTPAQINAKMAEDAGNQADPAPVPDPVPDANADSGSIGDALDLGDIVQDMFGEDPNPDDQGQAGSEPVQPDPEPASQDSVEDRIKQLSDQRADDQKTIKALTDRLLDGNTQAPSEAPQEEGTDFGDLSEDQVDMLQPIMQPGIEAQAEIRALKEELAPLREQVSSAALGSHLESAVDGFEAKMMPQLREWAKGQPADVLERYGNDSMGSEILAMRYVASVGGTRPASRRGPHPMAAQAAPVMGGNPQVVEPAQEATGQQIWDLSDEQFEALERRREYGQ